MSIVDYFIGQCELWARRCDLEIWQSENAISVLNILIDDGRIIEWADGYLYTNRYL